MTSRRSHSSGDAPNASSTIRVPAGLLPAARERGLEPHLFVWYLCRHLASSSHQAVDRALLHRFSQTHRLLSRSRLNAILREGEGQLWWVSQKGKVSGKPLLHLRGLPRVAEVVLQGWTGQVQAKVAELPIEALKGVARRRGAAYEAMVGKGDVKRAQPRSRLSQSVATGIPASTQRRWNRAIGTERIAAAVSEGVVPKNYRLDPKYLPDHPYRLASTGGAERHLTRRIGNITLSRFESHRSRTLRRAIRGTLLVKGESEHRAGVDSSSVRYTNSPNRYIKLREKGFSPRLRLGRGIMQRRVCWLYEELTTTNGTD